MSKPFFLALSMSLMIHVIPASANVSPQNQCVYSLLDKISGCESGFENCRESFINGYAEGSWVGYKNCMAQLTPPSISQDEAVDAGMRWKTDVSETNIGGGSSNFKATHSTGIDNIKKMGGGEIWEGIRQIVSDPRVLNPFPKPSDASKPSSDSTPAQPAAGSGPCQQNCITVLLENIATCKSNYQSCRNDNITNQGLAFKQCMCGCNPQNISEDAAKAAAALWRSQVNGRCTSRVGTGARGWCGDNEEGLDNMAKEGGGDLLTGVRNIAILPQVLTPQCPGATPSAAPAPA